MGSARVSAVFNASVHEAEQAWYDTSRWAEWVDGLDEVLAVEGPWPDAGATVVWRSVPAGRGRVSERVIAREPLIGQQVEVHDDSIRGSQRVEFTPAPGGVEVTLGLDYEITQRSIVTPLVDRLFIRRAMTSSLEATLTRFGALLTTGS